MRKLLVVLGIVALCSAPTWADSVDYEVNAWATITAPNNAVEKLDVSFLWANNVLPSGYGQIVNGSLNVQSSGFLGTFSPISPQGSNLFYLGLFNNLSGLNVFGATDEIDLEYGTSIGVIKPGTSLGYNFYGCVTQACTSAYGTSWEAAAPIPLSIQEGSTVTAKTVPDGDSPLLLSLGTLGAVGLAWRWRRKESSAT
ncbi:MAG: hypothetical protein WB762_34170 [Candidatus Sulfotelmatobacter sp.]